MKKLFGISLLALVLFFIGFIGSAPVLADTGQPAVFTEAAPVLVVNDAAPAPDQAALHGERSFIVVITPAVVGEQSCAALSPEGDEFGGARYEWANGPGDEYGTIASLEQPRTGIGKLTQ